ncbi:MAG: pantetheine-phosphate adenylyltransferase [Propionibacteriales bacterium]|nr:pantetheine-phosphate adenylyltransferase [Propionibacteriales bacterium]
MHRAVFPGSFDPVTYGHLDVVSRASSLFDEVVIAVLVNESKRSAFSIAERMSMLGDAVAGLALGNVRAESFDGLLVDFCRDHQAAAVVKGLRASTDVDYELPMAQMNSALSGVDTVLLPTSPEWSFVSSSLVKEVVRFGGDVSPFVPPRVGSMLRDRLAG